MIASDNGMCVQKLKVVGSPTEAYLEWDDRDLFLRVEGWLTPELAQALIAVLVDRYG